MAGGFVSGLAMMLGGFKRRAKPGQNQGSNMRKCLILKGSVVKLV